MGFTTYENVANPHVTIHRDGCGQIKKHGRVHKYGQGRYEHHETYTKARIYTESTHLPKKDCSFCNPPTTDRRPAESKPKRMKI